MVNMAGRNGVDIFWDGRDHFMVTIDDKPVRHFNARTGGSPERAQEIAEDRLDQFTM